MSGLSGLKNAAELQARESAYYVRDCDKCGCPLGYQKTAEGKLLPLDLRAPVFAVVKDRWGREEAVRTHLAFVNHFSTCTGGAA